MHASASALKCSPALAHTANAPCTSKFAPKNGSRRPHLCHVSQWRCRSLEQEYLSLSSSSLGIDPAAEESQDGAYAGGRGFGGGGSGGGGGGGSDSDTIAAVVTGAALGAVSIIRLSGPEAVAIAQRVFLPSGHRHSSSSSSKATSMGPGEGSLAEGSSAAAVAAAAWKPRSHRVYHGHAVDAEGAVLDEVLLLAMLEPRSYTAEDVVEVHTHGGGLSAQRVLRRCVQAGARLAAAGEFTLRAFLNGRLDLSQAESVAQLIDARTVAAADSALAGLAGGLGQKVAALRGECLDILAELEARLDFDDDLPPLDIPALMARIRELGAATARAVATARTGALLRRGLQVALVGRPNVGKSSLLNALSGSERAIVTDVAGTTRDVVEAGIVIGGVPITLLDTAGLRQSADVVEQIGVQRSWAAARQADIVLMVADASGAGWTRGDADIFDQIFDDSGVGGGGSNGSGSGGGGQPPALLVLNKVDLAQQQQQAAQQQQLGSERGAVVAAVPEAVRRQFAAVVATSASTLEGLPELRQAMLQLAGAPELAPGGIGWAVNERQAEALVRAGEALARAQGSMGEGLPLDFWTIDLRAAALALGEVSGEDVTEEVLDTIFARFCIGK